MKRVLIAMLFLCLTGFVMAQEANETEFKMSLGDTIVWKPFENCNMLGYNIKGPKVISFKPVHFGEKIEIVEPDVFIDGKKIPELKPMVGKYGEKTPVPRAEVMQGPVALGEAEYFACGDNSASSYDSRYWGPVPASNLRGVAGGVFWPFASAHFGPVK